MAKSKKKRSFFYWVFAFFNIIAVLALLISYFAAWVNPEVNWQIAFFGLAYPFFVIINFLFAIYWIIRKRWFAIIPIIAIAIGWNTLADYIQFNSAEKTTTDNKIKILSYNAHLFKPIKTNKYDKQSKHEMMEMILNEEADVMCIQEFYYRKKGIYDIKDSLIEKGSYKYFEQEVFEKNETETMSMAVLSKYKILNTELVSFYDHPHANMCMIVDILKNGDTIRLFNVHLQSISFQPEDYQYLDKVKSEVDADLVSSKRIGFRLKNAFIRRAKQAERIKELIDESPYPVIVAGDFNDTPASYAYHVISNNLKNTFREKGFGVGMTYNGAFPNFQIDYILCSEKLQVLNFKIIKKKYSDHYPIVSEIGL